MALGLVFMGGGFVQLAELDVDKVYKKMGSWLSPRLPYIPDLSEEERGLVPSLDFLLKIEINPQPDRLLPDRAFLHLPSQFSLPVERKFIFSVSHR
jgi:hypothetical protein